MGLVAKEEDNEDNYNDNKDIIIVEGMTEEETEIKEKLKEMREKMALMME